MSDDRLRDEHDALKADARNARRAFRKSPASAFVREMESAMGEYLKMRAEGVERDDACRGLESVLRAMWPKPTTKFDALCDLCDDTGWRERRCTHEMRCGRQWCALQHPAHEHRYVEPCGCVKGDLHRPQVQTPESEIAAVGRTKKRDKGFSRFGTR